MNLAAIRNEVLARGFDQGQYGSRINLYINDAQDEIARQIQYYVDEQVYDFSTIAGTSNYALPSSFATGRSLNILTYQTDLSQVGLRDIDNSLIRQGRPYFYAYEGATLRLYPTPDGVYSMQFRYWVTPTTLVNDTDTPTLPADMHNMLWIYATWQCFEADDDIQVAQYWQGRWKEELAQAANQLKFTSGETPNQVRGMWDRAPNLTPGSWIFYN